MSISVEISDLQAKTSEYGWAYLLTVGDAAPAHVVAITPVWDGSALTMLVGERTAANVVARPTVTLCYPPSDGGYSLIIDGEASVEPVATAAS